MHELLQQAACAPQLTEAERSQLLQLAQDLARRTLPVLSGPPITAPASLTGSRYQEQGILGQGGMGTVYRVWDPLLKRSVALKVASLSTMSRPDLLSRFVEEAQVQAQLDHPNLVPVHELGWLQDGRPYFTMDIIRGQTLTSLIMEVHAVSTQGWASTAAGWSFKRLIDAFAQVCRAAGFAHDRGVIHRDLKPDNIMIGHFGEVRVVDWGIARVGGKGAEPVITDRSEKHQFATRMGAISGTPGYMAPEQALGQQDQIGPWTDVYALGSTLYELLTGKMPYDHIGSLQALLQAVIQGPPNSIQAIAPVPPPGELVQIAEKAMNRDPKERYSNATALAAAVEAWLDGSKRREQALSVVAQAQLQQSQARLAAKEAEQLKKQAEAILKTIPPWSPEETKWQGWETEDQAAQKVQEAELLKISEEQFLKNALSHFDLLEAHAGLVELYIHQHAAAETARKPHATARLQEHLDRLPLSHPTRQYGLNYLKGLGAISLLTGPEGAEVVLEQYRIQHRRLVAVPVKYLGKTPLSKIPLEPGSWRLHIQAEGYHPLLYPISIRRGEHWDGLAPGERSPRRVKLLPQGTLGSEDCYIPAGWFQAGGDAESIGSLPEQRVWLEAFLMRRFPVTNKEYLDFLNQLVMEGSAEKALLLAPRERTGRADSIEPIYGFDGTRFFLKADQDGDMWEPDLPVCMVDFEAASVYAAWAGWRIPTELEWEKAARGVDGRFFPWGDHFDPSWCHMRESQPGRPHPVGVDSYPVDCSVYEVRGMAGNMGDWTESLYSAEGEEQVVRGGGWGNGARGCRISYRLRYEPGFRSHYLGIRLAKSVLGFE